MPHAILFGLATLFVRLTIRWHRKPDNMTSIVYGSLFALMVLCRPSEILLIIFPLLFLVYNRKSFIDKINFYVSNIKSIFLVILGAFVTCIPQLLYWKFVTGKFIFFSYQNTEGFNFLEPHILESLFSFKNSWIIYTPIIIFPLLGFINLFKKNKPLFFSIFTFTIINFYVLSSWLAWWNGGGFGMRYFVESYALLCIPAGYFITWLMERKLFLRLSIYSVLFLCISLNLFQTWQSANYIMPHDQRNFAFYKANFLARSIKPENFRLLDIERTYESNQKLTNEVDYTIKTIAYYNFDDINTNEFNRERIDSIISFSKPYSFKLDQNNTFSPGVKLSFGEVTNKDHFWVRFSLKFFPVYDLTENPAAIIITMEYNKRNFYYRSFELSDFPYKLNEWNTVTVEYLTPYPFSYKNEKVVAYVWLKGNKELYLDDIHIKALERKW
jgi:hypothetical protein